MFLNSVEMHFVLWVILKTIALNHSNHDNYEDYRDKKL